MTRRSVAYALAIAVLMGAMAVAALADEQGVNTYGPADESVSSQPEQGVEQPNTGETGEIREPTETGTVPDPADGSTDPSRRKTDEIPSLDMGGGQ